MYLIKVKVEDSKIQGKGYFADQFIPLGTIVYCYSSKDTKVSKKQFDLLPKDKRDHLVEFAVEDEFGNWVETETGPFTNHSCTPNIMPIYIQGHYLDIAIKDISIGEEITLDYGFFYSSEKWEMACNCRTKDCRKVVGFGINIGCKAEEKYYKKVSYAVTKIADVNQPIFDMKDKDIVVVANLIKSLKKITCGKFNKFSLING